LEQRVTSAPLTSECNKKHRAVSSAVLIV